MYSKAYHRRSLSYKSSTLMSYKYIGTTLENQAIENFLGKSEKETKPRKI